MWIFGLPPQGGPQENSGLNVRFFWQRLYVRYKNFINDYTARKYIITRHYTFSDELQTSHYTYKKKFLSPPCPDVFKWDSPHAILP